MPLERCECFSGHLLSLLCNLRHKSSLVYRSHTLLSEFSTNWYIPQVGTWNVACKGCHRDREDACGIACEVRVD